MAKGRHYQEEYFSKHGEAIPPGRILHVKRLVEEGREYYTLTEDGKEYSFVVHSNGKKVTLTLRCKSLDSLAAKVGIFRARSLIKPGFWMIEEDGFQNPDINSFYKTFREKYMQLLESKDVGFLENELPDSRGRKKSMDENIGQQAV